MKKNVLWSHPTGSARSGHGPRAAGALALAAALGLAAATVSAEPVQFAYVPPEGAAQSVSLRGEMNSWEETPMQRGDDGVWTVTVELPPGEYQYKYFVDGQWPADMSRGGADGGPMDAAASGYVDDGFGGKNALRIVGGGGAGLAGRPDLARRRAHWVARDLVIWDAPVGEGERTVLVWSAAGLLALEEAEGSRLTLSGADDVWPLESVSAPDAVFAERPHLRGRAAHRIPEVAAARAEEILRGQPAVAVLDAGDFVVRATGLQIPGVLDDLYVTEAPLGPRWEEGRPVLSVWAPTARQVSLLLFEGSGDPDPLERVEMREERGVWTARGPAAWRNRFYLFEVEVWQPATGRLETNRVTDPYSRGLGLDGRMSLLVDLDDPALKPEGWDTLAKRPLAAPIDVSVLELHVRDFSASDPEVPEELAGTYRAFARDSHGTRHLRGLAEAGLTHVHLMPAFDFASVPEDPSTWLAPALPPTVTPDSRLPQAAIGRIRDRDSFNWGYDPVHYGVPEGSYSTEPDGPARIREFREMVAALAGLGLRVVLDVVYNHTHASGQDERAVLDRVVPGYYHRLDDDGGVETSTCCRNTASEHRMMERLMVDDLVHWARDYKVDGFRFDLMGHHMKSNLEAARDALAALRPEEDGVDGATLYLYGEGWDFGEVGGGKRGVNATQSNLAGTGIGTFNDRFRDAARGGNPFGDRREQGFVTGRFVAPNGFQGGGSADRAALLRETERLRAGLAGNLRDYEWQGADGARTRGGAHGAYGTRPEENVVYVSAHDNETLWDKIQYAAPESATLQDCVRMQCLALSLTALAQGIPFFHAGVDLLRSKSMDADSYDSGDWFNRLDFTYMENNFGVGLPPAWKNEDRWDVIAPALLRAERVPGPGEIAHTAAHLREVLRIRYGSPLFRLRSARDVEERVRFHDGGRTPGLIVMSITDEGEGLADLDPDLKRIVVLFNAAPGEAEFRVPASQAPAFELHPVQAEGADLVVREATWEAEARTFRVPGRTTAVFVERH